MFDHVVFGASDYAASKAFFLRALEPLGATVVAEGPLGVEISLPDGKVSMCMRPTHEKPGHLHLAFAAESRKQVDAFYCAALEAGGRDNGAPGLRPQYHANYYAAFVIGPDGHNIEAVCHEPAAQPLHRGDVHAGASPAAAAPVSGVGLPAQPLSAKSSRIAACSCGQLQAHVVGEPVRVSVCHCLACQRRTGSVFGAQARFPREAVTVVGASTGYVRTGDEGTACTFRFCPKCGATVYYTLEGSPEAVAIPVGAFADPSFPGPGSSVYEERMHSWIRMPDGVERVA